MKKLKNQKHIFAKLLLPIAVSLSLTACLEEDDDKDVTALSYQSIEPPVTENTPKSLLTANDAEQAAYQPFWGLTDFRQDGESHIDRIKKPIFLEAKKSDEAPGCVGLIQCNLMKIDTRMKGLAKRTEEFQRQCLLEETIANTVSAPSLNGSQIEQHLSCQEPLSTPSDELKLWLAFGEKEGNFYLRQMTQDGDTNGRSYYAKANLATEDVEAWFFSYAERDGGNDPMNQFIIHFKSNAANNTLELSTDFDCGLQMKNNDSLIYLDYNFVENGASCETDEQNAQLCLNATTLEEAPMADCTTAELDQFELAGQKFIATDLAKLKVIARDESVTNKLMNFNNEAPIEESTEESAE